MDLESNELGLGAHPALLVVDMTLGFTDPECALGTDCPEVIAANKRVLDVFRKRQLPIFFTSVVYSNANQAKVFRARVNALNELTSESKWVQLHPDLDRQAHEVLIEKQWPSAFHKTSLDAQLRAMSVDSIVVTGLTTSGCVRATAVDGLQYDYPVVVLEDAVGDRNREAHDANLFDLQAKYADVMSSDALFMLLAR
ncbi:MAG: isochorismatase family protein [Pseudomonadales bacterium]